MKLTFYGGAKSVTGANYLLEHGGIKILVDCGLNQGSKYSEDMNYEKFVYDPAEINFVFITHSHTDHVGRLPKLFKEGFRGRVIASKPTIDLARKALPDNLNIITEEAKRDKREPIFELKDLDGVLGLAEGFDYEVPIDLGGGIKAVLHDAGHILGSTIVEIQWSLNFQFSIFKKYISLAISAIRRLLCFRRLIFPKTLTMLLWNPPMVPEFMKIVPIGKLFWKM